MASAPTRRSASAQARRARRDRRGRGMRGALVPPGVPRSRSRAEQFDDLVLDAVEHLEGRWASELEGVEFGVEEVPTVARSASEEGVHDADVVEDGMVPLARLIHASRGPDGVVSPPRIVLYRRPLELRGIDRPDLADLVLDVVVEQVANLLGLDPDEVDPD